MCVLSYLKEKDLPEPEVADVAHSIVVENSLHLGGNSVESDAHTLGAGVATVEGELLVFREDNFSFLSIDGHCRLQDKEVGVVGRVGRAPELTGRQLWPRIHCRHCQINTREFASR